MRFSDGYETFELPRLTLALEEEYKAARAETDRRKAVAAKLKLEREALGDDYVVTRCGSVELNEADTSEVDRLFIELSLAYNMNGVGDVASAFEQLTPILEQMERINRVIGDANCRQGFRRVV